MSPPTKRIAINSGGGYVPGLNAVVTGVIIAANELGWEVLGIRDGFDGLLFPDRYPNGGVVPLSSVLADNLAASTGSILGNSTRTDPFRVRVVNANQMVEEVDRSGDLLERIRAEQIDSVISVVSGPALSVLFKLHRKGLKTVCIPKSVENDIAATQLAFGFNSALSYAVETLDRMRLAAQSAAKIGVVEVLGEHSGWLALQAGIAVCADAVLIPEVPYDLCKVAARLRQKARGTASGLVVVAEGAMPANGDAVAPAASDALKTMLSPLSTGPTSANVVERSGSAAREVALRLQRLSDQPTYPLVLGQLVKAGAPTAVDRQLGIGYGAAAVRAIRHNQTGVMVAFQPPNLDFVPLAEAVNKVRTIPANNLFVEIARSLGISLGD
jgi:6-phosphofructokinase